MIFVTMIYWTSIEVLLNPFAPLDLDVSSLKFGQINVFWTSDFEILVFYLICSVTSDVSLNCISRIRFKCFFFWSWENQYMVHGFDSISIAQFLTVNCSVSTECSLNCVSHSVYMFLLLTLSKLYLFTPQFSFLILGQISAACSESWSQKLEFCVISFWFYYYRFWWSSWNVPLVLFIL